jgi:hypothetical protein
VTPLAPNDVVFLSPATASVLADAIWDELTAGHQTAGTTGKALTDAVRHALASFQVSVAGL